MKSNDIIANIMAGYSIFVSLHISWVIFLTFWDTVISVSFDRSMHGLSLLVLKGDLIFGQASLIKLLYSSEVLISNKKITLQNKNSDDDEDSKIDLKKIFSIWLFVMVSNILFSCQVFR